MAAVTILSIDPANGSIGVPTQKEITVTFDQPLDPNWVRDGNFFIEGSDREVRQGVFVPLRYSGTNPVGVISDPAYHGLVKGLHTLEYVDTNGSSLGTSFVDYRGTSNYYTKVKFIPHYPLTQSHPYKIYLVGTGTAAATGFGIRTRTVFDPEPGGANSGSAVMFAHGGYKGTSSTGFYIVEIVNGGYVGSATYKWARGGGSYSPSRITARHKTVLESGVSIAFDIQGSYVAGDLYTIQVKAPDYLAGITISDFVTGVQGSASPPTGTSITSTVAPPSPTAPQAGFGLAYTIPANLQCNVSTDQTSVDFVFNQAIDLGQAQVNTNGMRVYIGPANGDTSIRSETSFVPNNITVSGSTLTINLQNT